MKKATFLLLFLLSCTFAQSQSNVFSLLAGTHFNQSNTELNTTTGIGLFLEPNVTWNNTLRLGFRFEPTALAYGEGVTWDACGGSCRDGANYVLNNYLKVEYLLGQPTIGRQGGQYQLYVGGHLSLITHKRWEVISIIPDGDFNTHNWVANPGYGLRIGALLGRFDLSITANRVGEDFQDYWGFSLGYRLWNRSMRE